MNKEQAIHTMNLWGKERKPFLFIIDYEMKKCLVQSPEEAKQNDIVYNFNGIRNYTENDKLPQSINLKKTLIPFSIYEKAFNEVLAHLHRGNSYLVNLTFETPIEIDKSLEQIFQGAVAKYRLRFKKKFVVFSPETFIKTDGNIIYTYPMKGTIDATVPNANTLLLSNKKELAEHATIVDLLRNDLSRIATNIKVDRFRYIDKIKSNQKSLLQVSSQISGILPDNFRETIGSIVFDMLPAGSITGAPKPKTLEIIAKSENHKRRFYTGVAGYFDGENIDSGVLIRYIENRNGHLVYKSGGGITAQSNAIDEYNELIDKIYVPIA